MINCSLINNRHLCFEAFPNKPVVYLKHKPQSEESVEFQALNKLNGQILNLFMKVSELRSLGISLTVWSEIDPNQRPELLKQTAQYDTWLRRAFYLDTDLPYKQKIPEINRIINKAIFQNSEHLNKLPDLPGIYLDSVTSNIFINIKGSRVVDQGGYGKIRKALWINAPDSGSVIVAKKTLIDIKYNPHFKSEIEIYKNFSNKKGIISPIAGGCFNGKYALFMPLYEIDLYKYCVRRPFQMTQLQVLSMVSQCLEGLATLSKVGVHGDLSPRNVVLRRKEEEIEAVIIDLDTFCPHGKEIYGKTNLMVGSPEYFAKREVSSKLDVWGLGISLHGLYARILPHCWWNETNHANWTASLKPDWSYKYNITQAPQFLTSLINSMLHPDPLSRSSAEEALERFNTGRSNYSVLSDD